MSYTELKKETDQLLKYLLDGKFKEVFDIFEKLGRHVANADLANKLETYLETYQNILKYSFDYSDDPEKEKVYNKLQRQLLELSDEFKESIILEKSLLSIYSYKKIVLNPGNTGIESEKLVDELLFQKEIEDILDTSVGFGNAENERKEYEERIISLFRQIWFTDLFKEAETSLILKLVQEKRIPWYDKSVVVSALTLSLFRYFDFRKFDLLIDLYESKAEHVWHRAFVGLVLASIFYHERLGLYHEIQQRFQILQEDDRFHTHLQQVILQYFRAKDTEKINKKFREELLPDMIDLSSKLEDKLNIDDLNSLKNIDEENPEWESLFGDSPGLYEKIEDFSKAQMEGSDFMMSAFSMLKHFSFFNEISNWFRPFYSNHPEIERIVESEKKLESLDSFIEQFEKVAFFCNSDKYSFCLNINSLPDDYRSKLLSMFNMELGSMNELSSDEESLNVDQKDNRLFIQYIQDLYRFFKLHPLKKEFDDIIETEVDIYELFYKNQLIQNSNTLKELGDFHFSQANYPEAVKVFKPLLEMEENIQLLEKTGFAFQKMKDYQQALQFYQKAEIIETAKPWLIKKIAYIHRKLGSHEESLKYYKLIEKLEPENTYILTYIGHSYLSLGEYRKAMEYYYKVSYFEPDNYKVYRPIAWSLFKLSDYKEAEKYMEKIPKDQYTGNDYVNKGHILLCQSKRKEAINSYLEALKKSNQGLEWFEEILKQDEQHLISNSVKTLDIKLLLDYLKFQD